MKKLTCLGLSICLCKGAGDYGSSLCGGSGTAGSYLLHQHCGKTGREKIETKIISLEKRSLHPIWKISFSLPGN